MLRYWLLQDKGYLTAKWGEEDCNLWGSLGDSCPNCGDCKHTGVDYGTSGKYENVYAVASGYITQIVEKTGQICIYNEPTNVTFCYLHLSSFAVISGGVQQGELIGKTGKTGANSIHLHFEARAGEKAYAACCYNHTINPVEAALRARGEAVTLTPPTETVVAPTAPPILADRIAFVSDRDGNQEIYLMALVGTTVVSLTNLTNNPADDYDPVWSPDGNRIAFISERDGNPDIYMLNIKDSIIFRLTYDAGQDSDIAWSPDGNQIAYDDDGEIYVVDLEGSNRVNITKNLGGFSPSWSPDGKFIVFSSDRDLTSLQSYYQSGIYKVSLDTTEVAFLSDCSGAYPVCFDFVWSPDGRNIMFTKRIGDADSSFDSANILYVDNLITNVVVPSGITFYNRPFNFTWSPDLSQVAFVRWCYDPDMCVFSEDYEVSYEFSEEIFTINTDGSNETRLTKNTDQDSSPIWSPNSKYLAFVSNRDGNRDIYVMNADGFNQVNLTNNPEDDWDPAWAPMPGEINLYTPEVPATPTSAEPLNLLDPESIVYWLAYDMVFGKIDSFSQVLTEDTLEYGTGFAGGRAEIDRASFLDELNKRIRSKPECVGYVIDEDYPSLRIWTKGWLPSWEFYMDLVGNLITSEEITFTIFLQNGLRVWAYFSPSSSILELQSLQPKPCLSFGQQTLITAPTTLCPSAQPQRMVVGERGYVCTVSDTVSLREEPGRSASKITALTTGAYFTVIG
jgi:TolB protein